MQGKKTEPDLFFFAISLTKLDKISMCVYERPGIIFT